MNTIKFPKLRLLFAGSFAFLWWFLLYPELCFPEDTYEVICEDASYEIDKWQENTEQLLQADEEQIIVKSRLFELWQQAKN